MKTNYNKALDFSETIKDTNVIKMTLNNLGILSCYDGEINKGIAYFIQSLNIEKHINNKKGIAESLNNIGAGYYYLENLNHEV